MTGRARRVRRLPWVVAVFSVAALVFAGLLGLTDRTHLQLVHLGAADVGWWVAYLTFAVVGALVASRRPENRIGWLMLGAGALNSLVQLVAQYASWGLVRHPGSLPGADVGAWFTSYMWTPSIAVFVLVLAYFPTGQLLSRRWRWLPWLTVSCTGVIVLVTSINLWPLRGRELLVENSDLVKSTYAMHVINVLWPVIPLGGVVAMASVVVRYRRAAGVERQQMKWLMLAGAVSAPMVIVGQVVPTSSSLYTPVQIVNAPGWCAVGIALAILRYRLYDIDRIVSRTVSYVVVTAGVVGVYVAVVAAVDAILGESSPVAVAGSTLVAAAAFQPLRRRVQRAVDRRFDRAAYDARRTVDAFSQRLRDEIDADTVEADLLDTVERAVAPTTMSVWLMPA